MVSRCSLQGFNLLHLSLPEQFPLLCLFVFLCLHVSSVSNFCLTQGGEGGHLFRLTCSVLLWGGRNTANKYHWHVWGVLTVYGPHWVCPSSQWHMLSRSTLLRLQVALQGYCPKRALHFLYLPGLSCSGSGSCVLHKGTAQLGMCLCPSQVRAARATRCLAGALYQLGYAS